MWISEIKQQRQSDMVYLEGLNKKLQDPIDTKSCLHFTNQWRVW